MDFNRGEWSRFMLQFLIEWPHPIIRQYLETGQSPQSTLSITIPQNTGSNEKDAKRV